ncbi:MAG: quinol:electron acceptor oxidoreductase subunit ActD, partial [Myxococcota bacterium]
ATDDDAEPPAVSASDNGDSGGELYGLLAEFRSPGELIAAAEKVRDAGFTKWDCYSPFPVHGIDPAMGVKRTILPLIVFVIGLGGLGGGLLLQWWTNGWNWPWIISGKPFFGIPANIPITFETTVLASVLATFFSMWGLNKLPQLWHPLFRKDRFLKATDDSFFIGIEAADDKFQRGRTKDLLEEAGAEAVEAVYFDPDPARKIMPKPVLAFIVISAAASLVPFALIAKARADKSPDPHYHIIPDMDFQPKAKTQAPSDLFFDGRASRTDVRGTVARGELRADDHLYRGIIAGQWSSTFPEEIEPSLATIQRGQNRYNIYCQPCHGTDGKGEGMVHKRALQVPQQGWVQPSNLHLETVIKQPHGQIYNTISNGIRSMSGYASQIPAADRWAIVLYIRALQRSQNASIDDLAPEDRGKLR